MGFITHAYMCVLGSVLKTGPAGPTGPARTGSISGSVWSLKPLPL